MAEYDIAVIGGDKRTAYMIPFFKEKGYRVISYKVYHGSGMEIEADGYADSLRQAVEAASVIVGGIPFEKKGIVNMRELSRHIRKCHKIFGGVIPEAFRLECSERGIACYDFMKDEAIAIFNAVATAEGAILEAMLHKQTNIHHSRSLVLGYGRCGKVLCDKLKGLSAFVTVCGNDTTELALAEALGMDVLPLKELRGRVGEFEYIYNTIPVFVLTEEILGEVGTDALIIDIASGRGGMDHKRSEGQVKAGGKAEARALHCLGLPGKYAGEVSAKRLAEYVISRCRTGGQGM